MRRAKEIIPVDPLGTTLGIGIAVVLILVAGYFIHRQRLTLQTLRADTKMDSDQRRYLYKQSWRRMLGAVLLIVLGAMMFGSVFLDYDPKDFSSLDVPSPEKEAAKQAVRFISYYLMAMLLILLVILTLAVLDFWAVARFGVQQQKQLLQEHQAMLETELLQRKHRQSELN